MSGPVSGLSVGKRPTTADTRSDDKTMLIRLSAAFPLDALRTDFDIDEVRIVLEESIEKFLKTAISVDDSAPCESTAAAIYQTTAAYAKRVDFCLGRLDDSRHVHALEEYGRNTNEIWLTLKVFAEKIEEVSG
jgi:hypothetical protein